MPNDEDSIRYLLMENRRQLNCRKHWLLLLPLPLAQLVLALFLPAELQQPQLPPLALS